MATSKGANTYNRQQWEDATKETYGKECKICLRPFTVFRWCPGAKMRFKKTEICQICSRLKNVCQTCLLDLEYGLPIQIRDMALKLKDEIPRSDVNKEYYIQNMASKLDTTNGGTDEITGGKAEGPSDLLMKLARTAPYYKRNRPHICSFWVRGKCRRGEECPYRHEKPTDPDDPLSGQNIKDRYFGVNDPVAAKLMKIASSMPALEPPEDKSITTLYIGNVPACVTDKELRDHFYQYGEIRNITCIPRQQCAFVEFIRRADAELAAEKTFNTLILGGCRLNIKWGHAQARRQGDDVAIMHKDPEMTIQPSTSLPASLPPLPKDLQNDFFNLQSESIPVPPPPLPTITPFVFR
ncbi:hypothetical protein V9T40_001194 [Parthenolecanium corni]|uniref:Pre-mRNA-splicing factor RBM22 n=1 Tax=Parthenolecanium corni TaxID=536013 RepID=A0AAN9TD37_9HEMI